MKKHIIVLTCIFYYSLTLTDPCNNYLIHLLQQNTPAEQELLEALYKNNNKAKTFDISSISSNQNTRPLFKYFPKLKDKLPVISLGDLPTPIQKLENVGSHFSHHNIFMKRDDLTGSITEDKQRLYGGNKVRKLEFLLADALLHQASKVITCGGTGSNHALATSVYSQKVGLKCLLLLEPQLNSCVVQQNLLLDLIHEAQLYEVNNNYIQELIIQHEFIQSLQNNTVYPYIIPLGGSSPWHNWFCKCSI